MSVNISRKITSIWPTTEVVLSGSKGIKDYSIYKADAIQQAKTEIYGDMPVPAEESIPDKVAYWIARKACSILIPSAIDYYMMKDKLSEGRDGVTISSYDKVQALRQLRSELESQLALDEEDVLQAIENLSALSEETPAISTDGLMVDPLFRAMNRGPI